MNYEAAQLARLRGVCPGAEVWTDGSQPLVYMPGLRVESSGGVHIVDALLCPKGRDGYETRLFFSQRLPVDRNWQTAVISARTWYAASWSGIAAGQPWLDILGSHLETMK